MNLIMISAKEGNIVFLKLSRNDTLDDLINLIETYEIKSGVLEGYGKLRYIEYKEGLIDVEDATLHGTISDLLGKPHIELYCYSDGKTRRIEKFVSEDFTIVITQFYEIELHSRLNEKGKLELSIGKETK